MFRQQKYEQMLFSTSSLTEALDNMRLDHDKDPSTEFSSAEEESREFERKASLDAKIEKSIKSIGQRKEKRRNSIEEGSGELVADSNHSFSNDTFRVAASERKKRAAELSVSEHLPGASNQGRKDLGHSISEHGTARPVYARRKSDLELSANPGNPVKAADARRRRRSTEDEPSAEEKRRLRLHLAQTRRRRVSGGDVGGQKDSNYGELGEEPLESLPRLRNSPPNRSQSLDDDHCGIQDFFEERQNDSNCRELRLDNFASKRSQSLDDDLFGLKNTTSMHRTTSKQRFSGGSSTRSRERLQRSNMRRTHSIESNSNGLQNQSTLKGSSRRKLSIEMEPSSAASTRRQKIALALASSDHGTTRRESGSKAQTGRRGSSRNLRSSGTQNETFDPFDQSQTDTKNFTWTWKSGKVEPSLRRSLEKNGDSKTSPSQIKHAVRSLLRQDFSSPSQSHANQEGKVSIPTSSDFALSDQPMPFHVTPHRQESQKKLSTKRTPKYADSLLTPGARRSARAMREHLIAPVERTSSQPNLSLLSPEPKSTHTHGKKTRSPNQRWQGSKSNSVVDISKLEGVVNTKDIGSIAKFLKLSNEAEQELERRKEQERQAKRSHIRARRRQMSVEWAS